ncbi:MAG: hypothetical protein QOF60_1737 [Actinomycetota bacterium]|jgi:hypothetical protein|nr:hypothetical protein [Actinomycetota bacterium]
MAEYDLVQDVNYGQKPKESKEASTEANDSTTVAKAIEHGRADALGSKGALHLQRSAGNAAFGALVQRSGEGEGETEQENPVKQVVNNGGGGSLDPGVRSKMESSLGYDFGGVKVHTDGQAAAAAKSVQAQAFTVGNNVVFNEGKYSPGTPEGQRIIAHELTHVVQQSQGDVAGESRGGGIKVSDPSDPFERQAESTADAVMSGGTTPASMSASAGGVQTLPLQRAESESEEVEDEGVQRAEEESQEEENEESAQTLAETNVQREEEDEGESEE